MPPVATRKGRRIASKACDSCRERKVQCVFEGDQAACRRCACAGVACTFLKERKPRGPPTRKPPVALALPVGELAVEHLCPRAVLVHILHDYLELVYPVLPLVHVPSFQALLDGEAYTSDASFFRLCVALCAVTVASIPRNIETYACGKYSDVGSMVERACHIVLLSRMATESDWQNRPTMGSMLVSTILTMASHYAGRPNQGWGYASEAIQFFRTLELYRKEGYANLNMLERELCKRAFWVLYIIQIHDRLSFIVPHTGLSFDPVHTDWEYLLPLELADHDLTADAYTPFEDSISPRIPSKSRPLPLISGFVALVKVFLCVVDLLSKGFPGSPPQAYAMTSGSLRSLVFPDDAENAAVHAQGNRSTMSLSFLLRIIKKLQTTLDELPEELKISTLDPQLRSLNGHLSDGTAMYQFDVMRANIHITSLYIQSTILETCSSTFTSLSSDSIMSASPEDEARSNPEMSPRAQLWKFRESIARELLEVLNFCSGRALEANGSSMIVKIREIAATLLDSDDDLGVTSDIEEQSRRYVAQFADILADLDRMGPSTIIPPVFTC